jgi:hypothetical protein
LQDVGDDGEVLVVGKPRTARRHRRSNEPVERVDALGPPDVHEIAAGKLRRFVPAAEIRDVAAGATRVVGSAAGCGLGRVEHRRRGRLLSRQDGDEDAEAAKDAESQSGVHRFVS